MDADTIVQINCDSYQLEAARKKMKSGLMELGVDINSYDVQLKQIRKYQLIENGKLGLKFDLKDKKINSESIIVQNDVFIPVGIALGFIKTPQISSEKYESIENQEIFYFNSKLVFSYVDPGVGSVSQAKALESLYYASLSFSSGNGTIIPEYPTQGLKRVPQRKTEGVHYYQNGIYDMLTEFPFLNGGNDLIAKFDVPSADTSSASGDPAIEKTYAVFQLIGFNISDLAKHYTSMNCKIKCVK